MLWLVAGSEACCWFLLHCSYLFTMLVATPASTSQCHWVRIRCHPGSEVLIYLQELQLPVPCVLLCCQCSVVRRYSCDYVSYVMVSLVLGVPYSWSCITCWQYCSGHVGYHVQ